MWGILKKYQLSILFLTAFLIRLIHLNQSLWLDEATTAITVKTYSFTQIITQFSPHDFHPPLYYLFMDLWTNVFGYSEIALRMPSVLFSLGAGLIIYNIGKIISGSRIGVRDDKNVGFWSAAFFLFNPLIIYYSQEARMYSMVTFFIAASFYYLVRHLTSNVKRLTSHFWLMSIFLILSFFTFYASIFYIATVYIYLLWKQPNKGPTLLSGAIVGLGIAAIAPLLMQQYAGSREALVSVTHWSLVLGKVTLKNLLLFPIKFTSGRISFFPKSLYYLLAGGWVVLVSLPVILSASWRMIQDLKDKRFLGKFGMTIFFLITPIILGVLFSFNSPLLQYFRFQYLIVFLSLALGFVVCHSEQSEESIKSWILPPLSGVRMTQYVLLVGFISWSLLYLLFPQFHREDWKSLANDLQKETSIVYMIPSSADPVRYYAPEIEIKDIRMTEGYNHLFILPYTTDIHGVDYVSLLTDTGYELQDITSFRELTYEYWVKSGIL